MARKTTVQLTTAFENGDAISGSNFSDVFESSLNLEDDTTKVISGSIEMVSGDINMSGSLSVGISIARGGWEDGALGNSEYIPVIPSEFIIGNLIQTVEGQQTYIDGLYTDNNGGVAISPNTDTGVIWYALKTVPKGFQATSFGVSGSAGTIESLSSSLQVGTSMLNSDTTVALNTTHTFLVNVIGDGENYVILQWNSTTSGTDELWGGKIFIERI